MHFSIIMSTISLRPVVLLRILSLTSDMVSEMSQQLHLVNEIDYGTSHLFTLEMVLSY